jgi:hypothetical protein
MQIELSSSKFILIFVLVVRHGVKQEEQFLQILLSFTSFLKSFHIFHIYCIFLKEFFHVKASMKRVFLVSRKYPANVIPFTWFTSMIMLQERVWSNDVVSSEKIHV